MGMSDDNAAEEIADNLLYLTGRALRTGDFDLFMSCFALPHVIETAEGRRVVSRRAEMQETFESVRRHLRDERAADLVRTVVTARFEAADRVSYTHAATLVGPDGAPLRKPYPVYSVATLSDGRWRVVSSTYAIIDSEAHVRALSGAVAGSVPQDG